MSRARSVLGAVFIGAGLMHFARPGWYRAIMPRSLPAHRQLVGAAAAAGRVPLVGLEGQRSPPASPVAPG